MQPKKRNGNQNSITYQNSWEEFKMGVETVLNANKIIRKCPLSLVTQRSLLTLGRAEFMEK